MKIPFRAKSILALILTLAMLLTLVPMTVGMANESETIEQTALPETPATETKAAAPESITPKESEEPKEGETLKESEEPKEGETPKESETSKEGEASNKGEETKANEAPLKNAATLLGTGTGETTVEEETVDSEGVEGTPDVDADQKPLETVSVSGKITWKDFPDDVDSRPSIKITLLLNGAAFKDASPISTKANSYQFSNLTKGANDRFSIRVSKPSGCTVSVSGSNIEVSKAAPASSSNNNTDDQDAAMNQAVDAVIDKINELPSLEDARNYSAKQLSGMKDAVTSAYNAMGELLNNYGEKAIGKISEELQNKLYDLKDLVDANVANQPSSDISLFADQGGTATVRLIFKGLTQAEQLSCTVGYTFDCVNCDKNQTPYSHTDTLSVSQPSVRYTDVNMLQDCTVTTGTVALTTDCMISGPVLSQTGYSSKVFTYTISKAAADQPLYAKIIWNSTDPKPATVDVTVAGTSLDATYSIDVNGQRQPIGSVTRSAGQACTLTAETIAGQKSTVAFNDATGEFTVTYTKDTATTNFSGTINWYGGRPATSGWITVRLYNKDTNTYIGSVSVPYSPDDAVNDTEYNFVNVPYSYAGYSVTATSVPGYTMATDTYGRSITYYKEEANHINLRVNVQWKDNNNKRCHRPVETTVYLYADGVLYSGSPNELQVKYSDNWTNVFPHLPTHYANGTKIKWSVRGAKTPYYTSHTGYASGSLATVTYTMGSSSSNSTTKTAPLVGDPAVWNAGSLTLQQRMLYVAEDIQAAAAAAEAVQLAKASPNNGNEIDFTALRKKNSDVAAWLYSDGTEIDYPVVKGSNNSYYLNHLYDKTSNRSGSLFIDSHCNRNMKSRNTVIYGHHMGEGTMFASLLQYKTQSFYDAHPTMQLFTPSGDYDIEIFAALTTSDDYDSVARLKFSGNGDFMSYVNSCIKKSDITTSVEVDAEDSIVTFVTCSYDYDNTRYLVMGRLVER